MAKFILHTADEVAAAWNEDQAWREECRRHSEKQSASA
jgi:hypothetical protein